MATMKNIGKVVILNVLVEGKCDLVTLVLLFRMTIHTSYQVCVMLLQLCKVLLHDIYKTKGLGKPRSAMLFAMCL